MRKLSLYTKKGKLKIIKKNYRVSNPWLLAFLSYTLPLRQNLIQCRSHSFYCLHLIQKRLSSELLHCALRIVAYPDRKAPWINEFLNSIAGTYYETATFVYLPWKLKAMWNTMLCGLGMQQCTNSLHPWCFAVWVCNNTRMTKFTLTNMDSPSLSVCLYDSEF